MPAQRARINSPRSMASNGGVEAHEGSGLRALETEHRGKIVKGESFAKGAPQNLLEKTKGGQHGSYLNFRKHGRS